MKRYIRACVIGVGFQAGCAAAIQAAMISDAVDVPSPAIVGGRSTPFLDPGDPFTPGSVFYFDDLQIVAALPIDTEFTAGPSGGTIEYVIDQSLFNQSGQSWIGLKMELGFGTGGAFVGSTLSDGLGFALADVGTYFQSSHWTLVQSQADLLQWGNGTYSVGTELLTVAFNVPDIEDSGYTFTLRQTPILIPEPASLAVLAMSGLAMSRKFNRRG